MRLDRLSGLLLTLLALCFCPLPARAALIPRSGDVQLASDNHELHLSCPAVAVGADGAAVTVWSRNTAPSYLTGPVLSRLVETDGTVGPTIQLSEDGERPMGPGIVAMEGGYVAYWTRYDLPAGTVIRFLDASGRPAEAARLVDDGADARVVAVGDRLAIVTRQDRGTPSQPGPGLRLRLVDRQGADVYAPRQLATTTDVLFTFALASAGEGGVVIAWQTNPLLGGELKAQAFDASGQPRSEPVVFARLYTGTILHVAAGGGKFVVGWSEERPNGVELRVFSLAGELLGAPRLPRATGIRPLRIRLLTDLVAAPLGAMVVWNTMNRWGGLVDLLVAGLEWEWERTTRRTSMPAGRLGEHLCGRVATNGTGDWAAAWKEVANPSLVSIEARTFGGR